MSGQTGIEWCEATWNLVTGCTKVSEGCRNCWACRLAATRLRDHPRYRGLAEMRDGTPEWTGEVRLHPELLDQPLRWRKPRRIFVCSQADLFHKAVPGKFIDEVLVMMASAGWHSFLVLTKRPKRMLECLHNPAMGTYIWDRANRTHGPFIGEPWPLPNVWVGVSVEDQKTADELIPLLLQTPAMVRWVSVEPLLGAIDLLKWLRGNKANDRSRESISCVRCGRSFLDRPTGQNLEAPKIDRGQSREIASSALLEGTVGSAKGGEVKFGRIPNSHVFGQDTQAQSLCPSCRLDGSQQGGHSKRNAGEPQERGARRYKAGESGSLDGVGEYDSRNQGAGQEAQSTERRAQPLGEAHQGTGGQGTITCREDVPVPDSRHRRGKTADDLECHQPQNLDTPYLNWLVAGGESGPNARPSHPDWFRTVRDQCQAAGVPFFFKQWGEWLHSSQMDAEQVDRALEIHGKNPERVHLWPDGSCSVRVSKKYAGRLLDDRKWNEFPKTP